MELEYRTQSAESMQKSLAAFLKAWIVNEEYSISACRSLIVPAFYEMYLGLSTASPGVRSKEVDEYMSESNSTIIQPIIALSNSMVGVLESESSQYSDDEIRLATKDIDRIIGEWATGTFNILIKWRESYKFESQVSLDDYAARVAQVQNDLKASKYERQLELQP
jgi:hypothetical protein